ncbi:MAG: hypothetical protein WAQ57_03320 [Candidatus Saccharimonadales bacterium]
MTPNPNLPKSSLELTVEADQASAKAFQALHEREGIKDSKGNTLQTVPAMELPKAREHFIKRPSVDDLQPPKSDGQFLKELKAEKDARDAGLTPGTVATEQVVEVDFSQSGQAEPVEVSHGDVA